MSDTNQVELRFVEESTSGTTPTSPALERFRFTGAGDLQFTPRVVTSNEIVPGRQVQDTILVGAEAGGSVDVELVIGDHDALLEAVMFGTWVEQTNFGSADSLIVTGGNFTHASDVSSDAFVAGDIAYVRGFANDDNNGVHVADTGTNATTFVSTRTLVDESPAATLNPQMRKVGRQGAASDFALTTTGFANLTSDADFSFTADGFFDVGAWVYVTGFSTAGANGWYRISAVAAGQLTFDAADHTPAADNGTGDTVAIFFGDYIKNGSTRRSFTLEEKFADHDPVSYQYFRGMHIDGFSLELSPQSIATGSFTLRGFSAELTETRVSGATELAALLSTPLNTSSNVGIIRQNGAEVSGPNFVLEATVDIGNNLRFNEAVGVLGAAAVGSGEFAVTGNLTTYFGNIDIAQQVINNTETSLDIRLEDIDGGVLIVDIPRLKFTAGAPEVSGKNADVTVALEYQGLARKNVTTSYTLLLNRFWATSNV